MPMNDDGVIAAPRPDSVMVADEADGLRIRYRWFRPHHLFMLLFCVFWDGFLVAWYGITLHQPNPFGMMFWFPLPHVAVGVGLTYSTLAGFLNHTTLRVSSDRLTVRHGPLPWAGGRELPRSEIAQLYREQTTPLWNARPSSLHYRLNAVRTDGRQMRLLTCDVADVPLFLEQELERYLGIADRRVVGEMPK